MSDSKGKSGPRERRSTMRLSDMHRMVDKVLPEHLPEKASKKTVKHEVAKHGERRGAGHRKS